MKNLIILAVVVLAVWFVFFRKRAAAAVTTTTTENEYKIPPPDPISNLLAQQDFPQRPIPNLTIKDQVIGGSLSNIATNLGIS